MSKTRHSQKSIPKTFDMTTILPDTNVLIRFLKDDEPFAEAIESADSIVIHPVVYAEYINGIDEKTTMGREQRQRLEEFLDADIVTMGAVSTTTALCYSRIYKHLRSTGKMIPQNDIWIAASALENGYEVATHDGHFDNVPMLRRTGI